MRKYDVIYILKENGPVDELRYSLRSIEKNMSHGDVWFYGGIPNGFVPDHAVRYHQKGVTKWDRVRSTLLAICNNENVPARFWLFNDDFYVLQRMNSTKPIYNKTLRDHYEHVEKKHGGRTAYSKALRYCEAVLLEKELPTLDYAVHMPMLIDKNKALETLNAFPNCPMFRSLYGNYVQPDAIQHADVKIADFNKPIAPEAAFLSTSNKSFKFGKVGKQLQVLFPERCKYEAGYNG